MGGLGDIFGEMFGGGGGGGRRSRPRGADIQVDARVDFKDTVFGTTEQIKLYRTSACETCKATGVASDSKMSKCGECQGQGRVRRVQQTMFGAFQTMATCAKCQGAGEIPDKPCGKCGGAGIVKATREFDLKIPAGISDGEVLRISGEGEAVKGGVPGDLYVTVRVKADRRFARQGNNILSDVAIPFQDAVLGVTASVETVDGEVDLKIPAGTQPGTVMRLKGKGIPPLHGGNRGDQLVTVRVTIPTRLTREQKKKLESWGE
jgi:molecular chaperone DnaJ